MKLKQKEQLLYIYEKINVNESKMKNHEKENINNKINR